MSVKNASFVKSTSFLLSKNSLRVLDGVNPVLSTLASLAIKDSPIDFGIPSSGGFRTAAEQRKLYDDNKSRCDGTKRLSKHQSGNALDFYAYVDGKYSDDKVHLTLIAMTFFHKAAQLRNAGVIKEELIWGASFGENGYSFNGWDYFHIEIK